MSFFCCCKKETNSAVLLGTKGSGKTSILNNLKGNQFAEELTPTIGFSCEEVRIQKKTLYLYDIGGNQRSLWQKYYEQVDGLIFIFDGKNQTTLKESQFVLEEVLSNSDLKFYPLLVLINKTDLMNPIDIKDFTKNLEYSLKKRSSNWKIGECSCLEDFGIKDNLPFLLKMIKRR